MAFLGLFFLLEPAESRKFTFHFQVSLQLFYCVQSSLRVTALSLKEILSTLSKTPPFSVCRPTQEKPLQLFYKGHSSRAKRRSSGNHNWTRFGMKAIKYQYSPITNQLCHFVTCGKSLIPSLCANIALVRRLVICSARAARYLSLFDTR